MKKCTALIRSKGQKEALAKAIQKPKNDKHLPDEEKVARPYKTGKLGGKTFDSLEDPEKDLNS